MDPLRKPPVYSNLEPVSPYDAPEVVPGSDLRGPLERSSSRNSPQVFTPPPSQKQRYDYYGAQPEVRPYYEPHEKRPIDQRDGERQTIDDSRRRMKMCGLRPKVFFWIVGVAIVILTLAAVLGGVLGSIYGKPDSNSQSGSSQNNSSSSSNSSASSLPSINSNTGLAAIQPNGDSTLYQYYQDEKGRIIENRFSEGKWLIQGGDIPSYSIIGSDATSGSPIAATSWTASNILFRQVFYIDDNGRIMSSNTTGTNDWPTPYNILPDDSAMPGTKALAVCADTNEDGLNGLRVYFASSELRMIREVGMNFSPNEIPWTLWANFTNSDIDSGAATVVVNSVNHLYLVNSTTSSLVQWTWDYESADAGYSTSWTKAVNGPSSIASGSDIAAVYDGQSTDYIFYEGSDGKLNRALFYSQSISNLEQLITVTSGSKFSASYNSSSSNNGATVFYQANSDNKEIQYETINRNGQKLQSGVVD